MKLRELLAAVDGVDYRGLADAEIKGLKTNSHACGVGDLFIGMPGTRVDGGDFWQTEKSSHW
jgi:UDP-N-acetylmuramoyl-L-alanyl-D-glutamate--2,6-diaminopimelate ligase